MNKVAKHLAQDLLDFVNASPTAYQATGEIVKRLEVMDFYPLKEGESWSLKAGGKYYLTRNDSSVVAFICGAKLPTVSGFRILGAHTDSPALKLKADSENVKNGHLRITTEAYGGPIISTWLDRTLSIAGRVMVKRDGRYESELIDLKEPLAIIPNLATHLNREVNKGFEYNKQTHLQAVLGNIADNESAGDILRSLLSKQLNVTLDAIGEYDLFFYDVNPGKVCGLSKELVTVGRIDNLAMCHALLETLSFIKEPSGTVVAMFYDNEEVGSMTPQGANSAFTKTILERICWAFEQGKDALYCAIDKSFLISADGAHAVHPNFSEKHDVAYSPQINGGPVIKLNANFRYATTAESASRFMEWCDAVDVPYQKLANRSDTPCGSTIGPMTSAALGIRALDVGNPMWAMHSICETAGVLDHYYMTKVLQYFCQTTEI